MPNRLIGPAVVAAQAAFLFALTVADGQGGASQTPSQGPVVARTADGHPDFTGIWQAVNTANDDILPHSARKNLRAGFGVVEGTELLYQPWAAAKKKENTANRESLDTEAKCFLPGVPRVMYMPHPFQIVQTPEWILMFFEFQHATRNIFMNTPHPRGPIEWWMGDSRGRWEGDTLVVDVVHFNDQTWFDRAGNFHSEEMHLVERYTPMGPDHINYTVLVEDPKVFTRPWTMSMIFYRHREPNFQLLDYECYGFVLDDDPIVTPGQNW